MRNPLMRPTGANVMRVRPPGVPYLYQIAPQGHPAHIPQDLSTPLVTLISDDPWRAWHPDTHGIIQYAASDDVIAVIRCQNAWPRNTDWDRNQPIWHILRHRA